MAEISREEIIKCFRQLIESQDYIEIEKELDKAISDMEKLEKIEKLVQDDYIDNYPVLYNDCGFNHCGGYCVEVRILNDIVKLYKNN